MHVCLAYALHLFINLQSRSVSMKVYLWQVSHLWGWASKSLASASFYKQRWKENFLQPSIQTCNQPSNRSPGSCRLPTADRPSWPRHPPPGAQHRRGRWRRYILRSSRVRLVIFVILSGKTWELENWLYYQVFASDFGVWRKFRAVRIGLNLTHTTKLNNNIAIIMPMNQIVFPTQQLATCENHNHEIARILLQNRQTIIFEKKFFSKISKSLTLFSCSDTPLQSPPISAFPQLKTVPSIFTAAKPCPGVKVRTPQSSMLKPPPQSWWEDFHFRHPITTRRPLTLWSRHSIVGLMKELRENWCWWWHCNRSFLTKAILPNTSSKRKCCRNFFESPAVWISWFAKKLPSSGYEANSRPNVGYSIINKGEKRWKKIWNPCIKTKVQRNSRMDTKNSNKTISPKHWTVQFDRNTTWWGHIIKHSHCSIRRSGSPHVTTDPSSSTAAKARLEGKISFTLCLGRPLSLWAFLGVLG